MAGREADGYTPGKGDRLLDVSVVAVPKYLFAPWMG